MNVSDDKGQVESPDRKLLREILGGMPAPERVARIRETLAEPEPLFCTDPVGCLQGQPCLQTASSARGATPRTDAIARPVAYNVSHGECGIDSTAAASVFIDDWRAMRDLARQLERELAEARADADHFYKLSGKYLEGLSALSSTKATERRCHACGYTESHDPNCPAPNDDLTAKRIEELRDDLKDRQLSYWDGEVDHLCDLALRSLVASEPATVSTIPCARCAGPCVEFTVPNDVWNTVVRRGGREGDDEYLCEACYRKAVEAFVRSATERRFKGQTIEQWAERAEISERNLSEWIEAHSEPMPYGIGDDPEHAHTSQCGFDRNASHSLNRYVCNCGWMGALDRKGDSHG